MKTETMDGVSLLDTIDRQLAFLPETMRLFSYVSTQNFDDLAALCDDDFGIVDLDPNGGSVMVRTRKEWEDWFHGLFQQLNTMHASTTTTITQYDVLPGEVLAMSVVEFDQHLHVGEQTHTFGCVVTIVWKKTAHGWQEARWHVSLIRQPDGME